MFLRGAPMWQDNWKRTYAAAGTGARQKGFALAGSHGRGERPDIEVKKGLALWRSCFTDLCGRGRPDLGILWPDLACPPYPGVRSLGMSSVSQSHVGLCLLSACAQRAGKWWHRQATCATWIHGMIVPNHSGLPNQAKYDKTTLNDCLWPDMIAS